MKIKYLLSLVFVMAVLAGCSGGHCIKVGGSYQGISSDIEYCFDVGKSKAIGVPVIDEKKEDGTTTELFSFTEEQVNEILDKVKEKAGLSMSTINEPLKQEHPVRHLLKIIAEEEGEEGGNAK